MGGLLKFSRSALLALLVLVTLEFQLYFSFQTPHFSTDGAYFTLRNVEHILKSGTPLFQDPLILDEGLHLFPPLYHYLLASLALIFPLHLVLKIVPALLIAFLPVVIYLLALEISENESAALFSAFLSVFTPILYKTISSNSISSFSLALPSLFFLLYAFMRIHQEKFQYLFLFGMILFPLLHPLANVFALILVVYVLLLRLQGIQVPKESSEILLFSVLYTIWATFVFYKNVFLLAGSHILWQNIPQSILSEFFSRTTILGAILQIGILPFLLGLIVVYKTIFVEKDNKLILLFATAASMGLLLWLKLIILELGMLILAMLFCILFAKAYSMFLVYMEKTHFSRYYPLFIVLFFTIIALTGIYPSFVYAQQTIEDSISSHEALALEWMREYTPADSVIAARMQDGHYITGIAHRHVIADGYFMRTKQVEKVSWEMETLLRSRYQTPALEILDSYGADYIFLSQKAQQLYGIPLYLDSSCFDMVLNSSALIFAVKCDLEES